MTMSVAPMGPAELDRLDTLPDAGFGALRTERGNLPLDRLDVRAAITGLVGRTVLTTEFVNVHDTALEATYIFPLPDRAAVTGMTMTADGRTVEADLRERAEARQTYDRAIAAGQRASIAEEERPDVFTMRVGNILPGERVSVELRLVGPLPFEDGAATFRFPLVVAPRYIPGEPLSGPSVGDGHALDTDAVPDASRITPPILLPGFPHPVRLSIGIDIDPAGLELGEVRSSLHALVGESGHLSIRPGERADRDFVLRLSYTGATRAAVCVPDAEGDEGTYQIVVLPPESTATPRPKDVVLLLDRSGSMGGWKMVAARRAAARVVDTLTADDRFAVATFDNRVEYAPDLGSGLVAASDRHRFRAVEHLSRADARGGTELLAPLRAGLRLLSDASTPRDRVLVLVTDGQVGNEDQILAELAPLIGDVRIHTVGIDRAVNAGFLGRLAVLGAGRCELVESEDRLDEAMEQIHRRIGAPAVTDLTVTAAGPTLLDDTRSPGRLPGIYPGVPLVVTGRYTGSPSGTVTVAGRARDGGPFSAAIPVLRRDEAALTQQWARARLRDLEDRYTAGERALEPEIVATSLRHGVLCRFTAYVAVDARVVTDGGAPRRITQPVELPSGWQLPGASMEAISLGAPVAPSMAAAPAAMPPPMPAARKARAPQLDRFDSATAAVGGGGASPQRQRREAAPKTAPASAADAGNAAPSTDVRDIIAVEARRLRDAEGLPAADRRDMLADLASRLRVLLAGLTGPEHAELHALVALLTADGADVDTLWREARRVLDAHAAAEASTPPARIAFWKR
jgi:Ca-activated chloride channel homolog